MIRIQRQDNAPASLRKRGEKQTRVDCAAYDACPGDYHSGVARFAKRKYYSAKPVKDLLVAICHKKCCYCEKKFPRSNLHVEHFRPKSGVRQGRNQKDDDLPGYYWLAYRWDNLLLSCHDCNNPGKGTRFPLANPKKRARSHNDDITKERPLFVNPVEQDPRDHIRFEDDLPKGITREGRMTIEGIGLRRPELREDRLEFLRARVDVRLDILSLAANSLDNAELQELARKARKFIEAAKRPDCEFSSMVIDYVTRFGL